MLLAILTVVGCVPRPRGKDVQVTNDWGRDVTMQVSTVPLAPLDERQTLGDVPVGRTVVFRGALAPRERYVFHARYDNNRLEFLTLCLTRESLDQIGWKVSIPNTRSTCPSY